MDRIEIDRARQELQRAVALLDDFESRETVEGQSTVLLEAADAALDAVRNVSALRHELIQARARQTATLGTRYRN